MTFISPAAGESIADMRKKLAAFEARRLGFGPDGAVESRSLNPCGQVGGGLFGAGNTCAKGNEGRVDSIVDILSKPENADGFTVDPVAFESPKDGIMVSLNPEQTTVSAEDVAAGRADDTIGKWFDKYAAQLDGTDKSKFIGGWLDGGQFYLDVATRYENGDVEKALEDAREAKQLAVFNLSTFNDTFVHYAADDPRKPQDYDTKRAAWLVAKGFTEQTYDLGRTTVRSTSHHRNGASNGSRAIPASGQHPQGEVHRGHEGYGGEGDRGGEGEKARSLNPCGQVSGGVFGPGNTCAAKGTAAVGPKPRFVVKQTESEPFQTGGAETGAAYRALFADRSAFPSDVLRAYGWRGDGRNIDAMLVSLGDSLDDDDKRESVAAFLVGVGRAIQDFPEIADTGIRASTRTNEGKLAAARFAAQFKGKIGSGPLGMTQEEYDEALTKTEAEAQMPAAFYNLKANEITILVDNAISGFGMRMAFSAGTFSSPSPIHIGYHEAAHAAHAKAVRREAGLPESGPLTENQTQSLVDARDRSAFKMATAINQNPGSFSVFRDSPKAVKDSPDAVITRELAARVSIYGVTNTSETVAEYLAGVAAGGIPRDPAVEELLTYLHSPSPAAPRSVGELTSAYASERASFLNHRKTSP